MGIMRKTMSVGSAGLINYRTPRQVTAKAAKDNAKAQKKIARRTR